MMVRRDKRLKLNGNNLVISQLEVAFTSPDDDQDGDDVHEQQSGNQSTRVVITSPEDFHCKREF